MLLPLLTTLSLGLALAAPGTPIKFARTPHAANDGRIAFSYHGDLWVADQDGGNPRRLTAHVARDMTPRFSPDGEWIAFTSDRQGNDDVWVIPSEGGEPRQLTFHSTGDSVLYWTPDGAQVLFASSRGPGPWGSPLYRVSVDGGLPEPLAMDRGAAGMIRQDGAKIAFNRIGFRYWRKHYRGNNNTDLWVQDVAGGPMTQLTDTDLKAFKEHTQDAHPMWGKDGLIYFLSERDGIFNLYRVNAEGGEPEAVTTHQADGVQYPSISPDGGIIVYENEFELWRLSVPDGTPEKVSVQLDFDPKDNLVTWLDVDGEADGFSPAPDGKTVAVDRHGELFLVPVDAELGEKVQVTSSAWRDRYQVFSPDGSKLAYVSDESGDEEIWIYDCETAQRRQLTRHQSSKQSLLWSPDGTRIAFTAANHLFLIDVAGGGMKDLAFNSEGGFSLSQFSADGRWLTYSRSDADLDSEVYLFRLADQKEINVTQHHARDSGGLLTPDGKTLVFTSNRDGGTNHLYALSLARLSEDPDDPLVRARKAEEKKGGAGGRGRGDQEKDREKEQKEGEDEEGRKEGREEGREGGEDEAAEEVVVLDIRVDEEGIDRRPRQLTKGESSVGSYFLSPDGKTVYYATGGGGFFFGGRSFGGGSAGESALHSIGIDGRNGKKVTDGSFLGMQESADGKTVFYRDAGGVGRLDLGSRDKKKLSFQFRVRIDHRAEWEQTFEEAWRVMKYRFYDPDMHGFDWEAIKARYKPLLASVGENQDLYDLVNEMIGELNASHTGISGPPSREMERQYSTRLLGVELGTEGGYYQVAHIHRDGPADKEWLELAVGDYVLAIDGTPIRAGDNYHGLLNHTLNDYVTLEVATPTGAGRYGEPRTARIQAVGSLRSVQYQAWVKGNREFVDQESGGRIGYVHIQSMNRASLEVFENEIDQYWNKNGMIIDIRYNGGGNTDQELIDILERRPYEYWNSRWGGRARGRRPRQAIAGPKVMLINWRSASDSEVTPQAFRDLELGRIVGNPTYGAVIATGSYRLLSGASLRTPGALVVTYDPTRPNNYGINLENFGVAPDVWVENTPEDELAGRDRELKAAVDEALRMLAEGTWQFGEDG